MAASPRVGLGDERDGAIHWPQSILLDLGVYYTMGLHGLFAHDGPNPPKKTAQTLAEMSI
jgi:hypothetical protein